MAEPQSPRSPRGAISPPTSPRHTVVPLQKTVKYNSNVNPLGTVATYHSVATPKHQAPIYKCVKCGSAMTSNSANCNSCGEVNPNYGADDAPVQITIPKPDSNVHSPPTIKCGSCEKPFPATSKFCQSCGHPAPSANPTSSLVKCGKCGSSYPSNSTFCFACGDSDAANPTYGPNDASIQITIPKPDSNVHSAPTIKCGSCEKPFPATSKFCQSCGHAAPSANPVSSLVKCGKCGSSYPSNSTFCFACGDSDAANRLPISPRGVRPLNLHGHPGNAGPSSRSGAPNDGSAKPANKGNSGAPKPSHDPSSGSGGPKPSQNPSSGSGGAKPSDPNSGGSGHGHGGGKPKDLDFKKFDEKFAKLQKKAPGLDDLVLARRLNKVILLLNDVTAAYNAAPSDESNSKDLTKRLDAVQKFSDDIVWDDHKKKRKPTSTPFSGSNNNSNANKSGGGSGSGTTKIPVQAESTVTFTHVPDAHSNPSGSSSSGASGKGHGGSGGGSGTSMDFDDEFKKFDAKFAKLKKNVDDYDDLELSPKINKLVHRLNKITDEFNAIKHDGSRDVIREHMKNELNRRQDDLGAWSEAIDWVKHEKKRKPESSSGSAKKAGNNGPNTNTGKSSSTASQSTGGGFVETQAYKEAIRVFLDIYARYNYLTKQQVWSGQSDQIVRDWDNWVRVHHPALSESLKKPGAHTAELEKVVNKYNSFAADLTKKLDLFDVTQEQRNFLDNFENEHNRLYEKFRDNLHNLSELEKTFGDLTTLKTDLLLNAFGLAEHPRYIKSMEVTTESLANMKEVIAQLKNDPNTKVSFGQSRGKARDPVVHNTVVSTHSTAPSYVKTTTTVTTTTTTNH